MPQMNNKLLTSMVTSVSLTNEAQDIWSGLLFYSSDTPITLDNLINIIKDPLIQKLFPVGMIIHPPSSLNENKLLIEGHDRFNDLENYPNESPIIIYTKKEGLTCFPNLENMFYNCILPIKAMLGCDKCLKRKTSLTDCLWKKAQAFYTSNEYEPFHEDIWGLFKNRKTKISNFTYVSPTLTAPNYFMPSKRSFDLHDFNNVATLSEERSRGLKERWRIKKFIENVCSDCPIQVSCRDRLFYNNKQEVKYCKGAYPKNINSQIIEKITSPFTHTQLIKLLYCSGALEKRYNKFKCFGTLTIINNKLVFALNHASNYYIEIIDNYKDAVTLLQEYKEKGWKKSNDIKDITLNDDIYAALIETAKLTHSPTLIKGWHRTTYKVLYVKLNSVYINPSFRLKFTWGKSRHGSLILPWDLSIDSVGCIYEHYGQLSYVNKEKSVYSSYIY